MFVEIRTHNLFSYTVGPRYMREIGTPKKGSTIMNLHIKRPRIALNYRIDSRKKPISQSHICKITDKITAYNEGFLYFDFIPFVMSKMAFPPFLLNESQGRLSFNEVPKLQDL